MMWNLNHASPYSTVRSRKVNCKDRGQTRLSALFTELDCRSTYYLFVMRISAYSVD